MVKFILREIKNIKINKIKKYKKGYRKNLNTILK